MVWTPLIVGLLATAAGPPQTVVQPKPDYTTPAERASAVKEDTKAAAIAAVKMQLKDPRSAQFRGVKRLGRLSYCGWVNAKNSYGGYTGFSVFFATDKATILLSEDVSSPNLC